MKPELPPMNREVLEAKVTALLLGELPDGEAALLRELIVRDADLAKFHAQLGLTLGLLRETVATPEPAPAAPMKFSEQRREKLLAQFKTVTPSQLAWPHHKKNSLLVPLAAVAAFLLLVNVTIRLVPDPSTWAHNHPQASYRGTEDKELQQESIDSALRKHNEDRRSRVEWKGLTESDTGAAAPNQSRDDANEVREPEGRMGGRATRSRSMSRPMFDPSHPQAAPPAKDQNLALIEPSLGDGLARREQLLRHAGESRPAANVNSQSSQSVLSASGQENVGTTEAHGSGGGGSASGQENDGAAEGRAITPGGAAPGSALPIAPAEPAGKVAMRSMEPASTDLNRAARLVNQGAIGVQGGTAPSYQGVPVAGNSYPFITGTYAPGVAASAQTAAPVLEGQQARDYNNRESLSTTTFGGGAMSIDKDSRQLYVIGDDKIPAVGTVGGVFIMKTAAAAAAVPLSHSNDAKSGGLTGGTGAVELKKEALNDTVDAPLVQSALPAPIPQPEEETQSNKFSTFSLNISDASYKLAAASLQSGVMPQPASIRSEEFINAFDYRDPDPPAGAPIGFAWDRTQDPFAHNRDWLRFSVKTAAQGREAGRPLNLVLLLDKSGSMERADRVAIIHEALRVLASQLNERDTLSVVVFARTARLWLDGVPGSRAGEAAKGLDGITPEGGTNLEEAMKLAYETALRHYAANGENRVVLLTDGAANLGNVDPETLKRSVKANREQGIALDCFGVGFDGYNDNLMETLSRTGNGRYGFINTPEEAGTEFAGKLAGALRVAASDVKVQVEFNPSRVTAWRQIGYAKHQLRKEEFRDNSVAAAQIGAAESGNALYAVEVNPTGEGSLCTVRVRFRVPGTTDYQEHAWDVPYTGTPVALGNATPATRLAVSAAAFSEWLALSPYAGDVTPDQLLGFLRGVPEAFGADARPKNLAWMIIQAKSISGK